MRSLSTSSLKVLGLLACLQTLPGCAPSYGDNTDDGTIGELASVPNTVTVDGKTYDVETEYLPNVVNCENRQAPLESMKAQAIAARTFLTYTMRVLHRTSLRDSQADQVMSCGKVPNETAIAAVKATAGQIMVYSGPVYNASLKKTTNTTDLIIAGSFVAGSNRAGSDCAVSAAQSTEKFVTVNAGLSGLDIHRTIPPVASPDSPANRGAMGQNLANCIAIKKNMTAQQILRYFYGDDIQIRGAASQDAPVPAPTADDPAGQATGDEDESAGSGTVTGSGTSTGSGNPPADVTAPDCSNSASYPCFSALLNCAVKAGTCVLTASDKVWRQCGSDGNWSELTGDNSGDEGECIASYDH